MKKNFLKFNTIWHQYLLMSADISCGKCGEKISTMQTLKSVKDVMKHYDNKCPSCGQVLSATEFSLDLEKK